jgi:hypothetical protein
MTIDRFYMVENEAGEPCAPGWTADPLWTDKERAESYARAQRKQFGERYTVATFQRVVEGQPVAAASQPPGAVDAQLAARFHAARRAKRVYLGTLAELFSCSVSQVSSMEHGRIPLSPAALAWLAKNEAVRE